VQINISLGLTAIIKNTMVSKKKVLVNKSDLIKKKINKIS
jgi:hypothetical protein